MQPSYDCVKLNLVRFGLMPECLKTDVVGARLIADLDFIFKKMHVQPANACLRHSCDIPIMIFSKQY
jgi:hypothetical protein